MIKYLYYLSLLLLISCTTTVQVRDSGCADHYKASWNNDKWSKYIVDNIETVAPNLISSKLEDEKEFCASGIKDRKQFWLMLISSVAKYESDFKPDTAYKENFKDRKGNQIVSRGLLQLSIESANGYGCSFKNEKEIHDPFKNLRCGLMIMNKWVGKDKRIAGKVDGHWKGLSRYWAVLRTSSKVNSIISHVKEICK